MQIEKTVYELLQQVEEKQKEFEKAGKGFNVFELEGIGTKEVIMCRILRGLIARDATHGRGPYFLKMFVKHVLGLDMKDDELSTAVVRTEQRITENRRVDLVIETTYRFLPIEVKIYAGDQDNQCRDYYYFAKDVNEKKSSGREQEWYLYYLTLTGSEPDGKSMGDNPAYIKGYMRLISWEKSILQWVTDMTKYIEERIDNFYSKNPWTGLDYKIADISDDYDMMIRIEVSEMLGMGVWVLKKSKDKEHGNKVIYSQEDLPFDVRETAKERLDLDDSIYNEDTGAWLFWKCVPEGEEGRSPKFKEMNDAYFKLYKEDYRAELIHEIGIQFVRYSKALKPSCNP